MPLDQLLGRLRQLWRGIPGDARAAAIPEAPSADLRNLLVGVIALSVTTFCISLIKQHFVDQPSLDALVSSFIYGLEIELIVVVMVIVALCALWAGAQILAAIVLIVLVPFERIARLRKDHQPQTSDPWEPTPSAKIHMRRQRSRRVLNRCMWIAMCLAILLLFDVLTQGPAVLDLLPFVHQ